MKSHMFFVAMFAASSLAVASARPADGSEGFSAAKYSNKTISFDKAVKNLTWCLSDKNEGVVKSALSHMVRVRMENPSLEMRKVESAIKDLIVDGSTPIVRYEAFLANVVMENPNLISLTDCDVCNTPDKLFSTIAAKLQDASFGPTGPSYSERQ